MYTIHSNLVLYVSGFGRVQNQVSGVISTMKDNINRVLERGDKLEDLEEKSGLKLLHHLYY